MPPTVPEEVPDPSPTEVGKGIIETSNDDNHLVKKFENALRLSFNERNMAVSKWRRREWTLFQDL